MDDYLTLEQLEGIWTKQDSYVGCVSAPQKITQYTYDEAVEAPLIADHSTGPRQQQVSSVVLDLDRELPPLPALPDQNDATVVDGTLHPALRPKALLG